MHVDLQPWPSCFVSVDIDESQQQTATKVRCLHLLLGQELALQNLLHLLWDVLGHRCEGGAQAAALVLESGMLAVESLEGLQAFKGREVLV